MVFSIVPRAVAVAAIVLAACAGQTPRLRIVEESVPGVSHYVLAVDLDGDGDLDLLGESGERTASNAGDGRFATGWTGVPTGAYFPFSGSSDAKLFQPLPAANAVCADFNGDGVGDFVHSEGSPPYTTVTYRPGLPGGGFNLTAGGNLIQPGVPPVPTYARGVAAGDVDGDGDLDLVVCCEWTTGLRLRRNVAGALPDATSGSGLAAVAVWAATLRDLDNDGDLDLLAHGASWGPLPAFLQENLGGGVFGPPVALSGTQTSARAPVVGDFDGDGFADVVRFGGPAAAVEVQMRDGPWHYAAPTAIAFAPGTPFEPVDVAAADLDGDGKDELVVAGRRGLATFRRIGGAFAPYAPEIGGPCDAVLLFDADQDGDPDALTTLDATTVTPSYRLLFNHDGGTLTGTAGVPHAPGGVVVQSPTNVGTTSTTVPIRGAVEGAPDLLTLTLADTAAGSRLWRSENDGYGAFRPSNLVPCPGLPAGVFFPTFLWGVLLNPSGVSGLMPRAVAGDFDSDGDEDVFVANAAVNSSTYLTGILRNDGAAGFVAQTVATRASATIAVASADLNGDGVPDCVEAATGVFVWLSTPTGFVASTAIPPTTATDVATGDFDDDGDLDLVLKTTAVFAAVWVNDGNGAFALGPILNGPSGPVDAADFDDDGKCDFAYGNAWYRRIGALQFAAPVGLPATPTDRRRTVVDVDDDADPDLLCQNGTILRNDGAPAFAAFAALPDSTGPGIGVDLDRDGDLDVVRPMGPQVFTNLVRQVVPQAPIRPGFATGFDVYGPPDGACLVGVSTTALAPAVATPYGSLALDPFAFVPVAQGPLDATGAASWAATIDPAFGATLVGTTFVLQAVVDGGVAGPRLTNARFWTAFGP